MPSITAQTSTLPSTVVKKPLLNPNQRKEARLKQAYPKEGKKKATHPRAKLAKKYQSVEKNIQGNAVNSRKHEAEKVSMDSVDGMSFSRVGAEIDARSGGTDTDRIEEEVMAQHLERILDSAQWVRMCSHYCEFGIQPPCIFLRLKQSHTANKFLKF